MAVFVLTVFVNAQTVVRTNGGTETGSGSDVATVQTADGAAEGDVLTISGTSTHNSLVAPVRTFTVQSANSTAQTINAGTAGCYNLAESGAYTITLSNLNYQGNSTAVANDGGFMYINNSGAAPALTLNNVSFSGFKLDNKHGGVICVNQGSLTINSTGTLSFSNNNAAGSDGRGAAIYGYTGSTQNNVSISGETIDFSNNTATIGGGAVARTNLTLTGSTITFNNNRANNNDGGAFHSGKLTITGIDKNSSTTFEGNSANYIGGAVSATDVTLSTGSFYFINNTGRTFHTNGRAGAVSAGSSFTATDVETLSFTGNKSASICGALASGGNISISAKNVTFEKNKTTAGTTNNTDYGMGGGILANGGNLTITADTISFKENEATHRGGAIRANGGNVTIDGNTISFSGNKASKYGAAIRVENSKALNITGTTITFENNTVSGNDGGAISGSNLTITGKSAEAVTTFKNNSTNYIGGAIGATSATFKTGSFYFEGNQSKTYYSTSVGGGAISATDVSFTNAKTVSFVNNTSKGIAGAINYGGVCTIEADEIIFNGNHADHYGGAIQGGSGALTIKGDKISFTGNYNNGNDGGAIRLASGTVSISGQDDESEISFSGNVSKGLGGGISAATNISTGSFTFNNNSAGTYGGAIHGGIITFSGDNTSATFTNNTAVSGGNDLNISGTSGTVLSFTDSGTYSFDGGIRIANTGVNAVIDKAQVTIAGRANISTNNYQLQNVTISNDGSLTANLDYIDSLTGTFNVGTADTAGTLELNVSEDVVKKLNADSFKVVRTDLGEVVKTGDGTLQLCNEAQDLIDINGLVVSSGRMDILGYMTGGITVEPDSVFSPGNSVGDARFGGGYELKEDAMLLIEQDASGIDTLTATSFDIDSNSIIDFAADSLQPGASYDIIFQTDSEGNPKNFTGDQATDDFWNNLLTPESAYYWNLTVSGNVVRASVDPNAVPEPSTWALLILGAAGLLYVRKRKN